MRNRKSWSLVALAGALLLALPTLAFAGSTDGTMIDNALLELKVKTELIEHFGFGALAINVEAENGAVTLLGTLDDRAVKESARNIVASVDGVRSVDNKLTLEDKSEAKTPVGDAVKEGELEVRDALLEVKVKSALFAEVGRHGFDVEVEASSGTVTLEGTVPDEPHHELALKATKKVKGVEKVVDLLKLETRTS